MLNVADDCDVICFVSIRFTPVKPVALFGRTVRYADDVTRCSRCVELRAENGCRVCHGDNGSYFERHPRRGRDFYGVVYFCAG